MDTSSMSNSDENEVNELNEDTSHNSASDMEGESLMSLEKLDRLSPDLWNEQFNGLYELASLVNSPNNKVLAPALALSDQDQNLLCQFGALQPYELIEEISKLLNVAYQLGIEEAKQMTRGKYMEVLTTNKQTDDLD